jgi:sugar phosphate isomerase/epimerase
MEYKREKVLKVNQSHNALTNDTIVPLKGVFPFRIGTTSYILPDDLVPNVKYLSPLVDDVELVLFESEDISNLPDEKTIHQLKTLKQLSSITYTVHLPLDIYLGSLDENIRKRSVDKCLRVINLTAPLNPFSYILHFHGDMRDKKPSADMNKWKQALDRSVGELLSKGVNPDFLSVETLDYPFEIIDDIVFSHNLSVCLDVGHLAFYNYPIKEYLDKYFEQTKVIHLHGNTDGKDHKNITLLEPFIIDMLMEKITSYDQKEHVLTMEVFGYNEFITSMDVMRRYI